MPSKTPRLVSSYPWEYVDDDNIKTWRFMTLNFSTKDFDPKELAKLSKIVEEYVAKYFFPSYRLKVDITNYTLPSEEDLIANGLAAATPRNQSVVDMVNYIPIYLISEFSDNITNGFGTAVHGGVNDSVMNSIAPLLYINDLNLFANTAPLAPGMPFIVIAAGSVGPDGTDNGIRAEVASNKITHDGPTDFNQVLAHTIAYEMIEVLGNPLGLIYIINGDSLGTDLPSGVIPRENCYLKSLCAPFANGKKNLVHFKGFSMPNFALPSYFFPYADVVSKGKAVFDLKGNGRAPFVPYQGTQFVMYQEGISATEITDLNVGQYVSYTKCPRDIFFIGGGSAYDYASWGYQLVKPADAAAKPADVNKSDIAFKSFRRGNVLKQVAGAELRDMANKLSTKLQLKAVSNGLFNGRKKTSAHVASFQPIGVAKPVFPIRHIVKCERKFDPTKPHVLPFQYINSDGFLTQRYAVINYSPEKMPPEFVDRTLVSVIQNIKDLYLPHWNIMSEAKNYTIFTQADVPKFDGTFIPFFITVPEQYRTDTSAVGFLAGGASDVNNVPDVLGGPKIDFFLKSTPRFDIPDLPLGNPLVICSDLNFHGLSSLTTDQPGIGPYEVGVASFEPSGVTFPITANGVVATPDPTCCVTPTGTTTGLPIAGNTLVFTNNPPCQTAGPQRYTEVNNSGCIASVAVRRFAGPDPGFPSNLGLPYVDEPSQYMVGISLDNGTELINAINEHPDMLVSIHEPTFPAPASIQVLTLILSHEFHELNADPNYATYVVAASDPPTDQAIVFAQIEPGDPMEAVDGPMTIDKNGKINSHESPPAPAYFLPYLKFKAYDQEGLCPKPLVPISRQQWVTHVAPIDGVNQPLSPNNLLALETSVPGALYSVTSFTGNNIFDPTNYYEPLSDAVLFPPDIDVTQTPYASIVDKLLNHDYVYAYTYGGVV